MVEREARTRLGWTISYKSLYFVHPSLELLPLLRGMRKRSFVGETIRLQLYARTCFALGLFSKCFFSEITQPPPKNSNGKNLIDEKNLSEIISKLN